MQYLMKSNNLSSEYISPSAYQICSTVGHQNCTIPCQERTKFWAKEKGSETYYIKMMPYVKSEMTYRVIHKSLRDFRTRLRNNQDRHGRKEHINR